MKYLIKRLLERRGLELLYSRTARQFIAENCVDLVIYVGANVGQFASSVRKGGYRGEIWSFEPVASAFAQVEAAAGSDPLWKTFNCAIGAAPETSVIHVSGSTVFSSLKATTAAATAFDKASAATHDQAVQIRPLSEFIDPSTDRRLFLKIDTQGYEQEVLAGAETLLNRCVALQLELPIEHLYEGVWTLQEALAYLSDKGFALAQVRPVNFSLQHPASAIEFDCIFRRA